MWNCPICKRPGQGLQCRECGFDGSLDYENYPSLGKLPRPVKSIVYLQNAWKAKRDDLTACPDCGSWQFYLSKTKSFVVCAECGKKLVIQPPSTVTELARKTDEKNGSVDQGTGAAKKQPIIGYTIVGERHAVTLHGDGTVTATGDNQDSQCNVTDWTNIRDIAVGYAHTVGLCEDGTVVATGRRSGGRCLTQNWKDIQAIAAGWNHTVGLCEDGTAVSTGADWQGSCDVGRWRDLCGIAAGRYHTVGLRKDGTVAATGSVQGRFEITSWTKIQAIAAGEHHTVGLRQDGTVVAAGSDSHGQCKVSTWRQVVAIAAGGHCTVGLRKDGSVLLAGECSEEIRLALVSQMKRNV